MTWATFLMEMPLFLFGTATFWHKRHTTFAPSNANRNIPMIQKEKIYIRLHALSWTMGEVAFFDFALSGIGSLKADWGDGRTSSCQSFHAGEPIRIEHDYGYGNKAKASEEHFVVSLECFDCTFMAFDSGYIDMHIDELDFSEAPSIERLRVCWNSPTDLSPLVALKRLECRGTSATVLDLRCNTNIEFLDCSCSEVQKVLASKCDRLREIRCSCCHELREITLSNESQLTKIEISSDHKIKENPWNYVQKTIQQNNGEIEIWIP